MDGPDVCSADEKRCGGDCVSKTDPEFGCGAAACDPCNERDGSIYFDEEYACSAAGTCQLVSCSSGASSGLDGDCDGNLANGCEVNLGSDELNCGACGNVCPDTPLAGAAHTYCSGGICRPSCVLGRSDPDGVLENGCETTMPFVIGDACPSAVPADGSQCQYLDTESCYFFTPGSRCVTRASCHFINIGQVNWNVQDEDCSGRRDGEFCELDLECASFRCSNFECLAQNGSSCTMDEECASGACCPTATEGSYTCASSCALSDVGAACTWGEQCVSGVCNGTTCGACPDADCTAAICGSRECGSISGVDCGTCTGSTDYCNAGVCEDACSTVECGTSEGVDCGGCTGQDYCDAGVCEDACATVECGDSHGIDCGTCSGTDYCDNGQCEDACDGYDCGTHYGVDCGTCSGTDYCNDGSQCEDACAYVACGPSYYGIDCGGCGVDEACDGGSCEPIICPVDQDHYCKNGDVWSCDGGTSESLHEDCGDTEFCVEDDETCNPRCTIGLAACINGVAGTCAADQTSLEGEMRDCEAESMLCYAPAGCGHLNTDNHASSQCVDSYDFVGNVYEMNDDRFLLNLAMNVSLSASTNVSFSVYTGASEDGPFTLEESTTVTAGPGQGQLALALPIALTAGQFVVLAASVPSAGGFACHGVTASASNLSFGRSTGKGYLLAADPGATIAAVPTAVTSFASITSFWAD